jgi:hypothetical protein
MWYEMADCGDGWPRVKQAIVFERRATNGWPSAKIEDENGSHEHRRIDAGRWP